MPVTRRVFVAIAAAAPLAAAAAQRPQLCIFSKHMPKLNYEELGKTCKQMGFDGVDLTTRAKGHVLPERAAEDLPRAVETIRSHGIAVPMITTDLLAASHATARPILGTAGKLKVPFFKPGYYRYGTRDPEAAVAEVRRDLEGLVALGKEHGVACGFHNHSGGDVGEMIWDTRAIIAGMDPRWVGYYFDPCHATIEGGLHGWEVSLRLVTPRLKMVAIKDFYWEKQNGKWRVKWCPLGEGMVNWQKVFAAFAAARFTGPVSLHIEYEPADEMAAIARDLEFLKKQVAAAYGG